MVNMLGINLEEAAPSTSQTEMPLAFIDIPGSAYGSAVPAGALFRTPDVPA